MESSIQDNNIHETTNEPQCNIRIQQTIPQDDMTPNKKNEARGASITNMPPTTFRIYFQNINGLQLQTTQTRWHLI
jgi:hypothetical protein